MDLDHNSRLRWLLPLAGGALLLWVLDATRGELMAGLELDFGRTLNLPAVGHGRYLALWLFYASLAAVCLTVGFTRLLDERRRTRLLAAWNAASDRRWIVITSALAFLIPATLRVFLLGGAPLTDDESGYRFMAEVLARGRVYADSPPLKLFFDNRFMINDGKHYAHFFVGWPALLAPGVWLGATGIMNACYSALTVPALFAVLRRLTGSGWARLGVVLYLSSPMLMVAAATETAHTSCVAALAWFTLLCLKTRDDGAPWWTHSAAALAFSVVFFIRPISALGIGLPLLVWWLSSLRGSPKAARGFVAFALPALAMAALFLSVNKLQTGSFFEVAYQRAFTYAQENGFRFSLWPENMEGDSFAELGFGGVRRSLSVLGAALFRLNVSFLGWPCSLLFALFAGRGRRRGVLALSVVTFLALHFFTNNVGIDTFAPMHYFEVAWPLLLLSVCGLEKLSGVLGGFETGRWPASNIAALPAAAACALMITSLLSYMPVRFAAISRVADNVAIPWRAHREAGLGRSVVFAPEPFIIYCQSRPATGWVFVRPNNDPNLENEVLWVNHLSIEKNRLLMRSFPDRAGYVMAWDQACRVVFLPLDRLAPGSFPDAKVDGIEMIGGDDAGTEPDTPL